MTKKTDETGNSDSSNCSTADCEVIVGDDVVLIDAETKVRIDKYGAKIKTRGNGYGKRYACVDLDGKRVQLARLVMNMHDHTKFVCHKNRNALDCRKENLCVSSNRLGAFSDDLGPAWGANKAYYWEESKKMFRVMITVNKKKYYGKEADTHVQARANVVRLAQKLFNEKIINQAQLDRFLVG